MLRATLRTLLFVPALALASCAPSDPIDEPVAEAEDEMAVGLVPFAGTYVGEPSWAGDFARLVLMTDRTYHAERMVVCVTAPCPPIAEEGTYRLIRRELRTFIQLVDDGGDSELYQYLRRGAYLNLRRTGMGTHWQLLHRSTEAWCAEPVDCTLQGQPPGPCVGHYRCVDATCSFRCGFGPPQLAGEPEPCGG